MKDPGPIRASTEDHKAALEYANSLAKRFEMAPAAIFGQVLRFDDALRRVTQNPIGMASLVIDVRDPLGSTEGEDE
jgi:hypothetical protein